MAAVSLWGVLAGIGGLTHVIGELLQRGTAPDGLVFDSWTAEPIATNLGGEPTMTLLPGLTSAAIATAVTSTGVIVWSLAGRRHRHAGAGLAVGSVLMLLSGGGFGPPVVGLVNGAAARILRSPSTWPKRLPRPVRRLAAASWRGLLLVVVADALLLFLGSVPLALAGLNAPMLFVYSLFLAVAGIPVATLAATIATDRSLAASPAPEHSAAG